MPLRFVNQDCDKELHVWISAAFLILLKAQGGQDAIKKIIAQGLMKQTL
jgi:hypothetical protein